MSNRQPSNRQPASISHLLAQLLAGLGAGFVSGSALAWWLARYEPLDAQDYASLRTGAPGEAELLRQIDPDRMRRDTEALSSINNRRGGTPGELAARDWARQRFLAAGLRRVHFSPVVYPRWRRRSRSEFTLFTPAPYSPDFIVLNGSAATPAAGLERPLVDVGRGAAADYAVRSGRGLRNAVHLIIQGQEARRILVQRAVRHGAAAVILANANPSPAGKTLIENGAAVFLGRIPALAISHETGQRLRKQLNRGRVSALLYVNTSYGPGYTANVIGDIPGQSAEYVVLAAHYDAWYAGAADNAAGLACLLELARIWAQEGLRPRRTIRFISFAAEEEALMGSLFQVITRAPLVKARCRGVVTPDVVGAPCGALRLSAHPPLLAELAAGLAQQMGYSELSGYPVKAGGGLAYADHWPYSRLQLPALAVSKGPDPFYHTPYDTADRLDYSDLRWTAALVGVMALRLAQR